MPWCFIIVFSLGIGIICAAMIFNITVWSIGSPLNIATANLPSGTFFGNGVLGYQAQQWKNIPVHGFFTRQATTFTIDPQPAFLDSKEGSAWTCVVYKNESKGVLHYFTLSKVNDTWLKYIDYRYAYGLVVTANYYPANCSGFLAEQGSINSTFCDMCEQQQGFCTAQSKDGDGFCQLASSVVVVGWIVFGLRLLFIAMIFVNRGLEKLETKFPHDHNCSSKNCNKPIIFVLALSDTALILLFSLVLSFADWGWQCRGSCYMIVMAGSCSIVFYVAVGGYYFWYSRCGGKEKFAKNDSKVKKGVFKMVPTAQSQVDAQQ